MKDTANSYLIDNTLNPVTKFWEAETATWKYRVPDTAWENIEGIWEEYYMFLPPGGGDYDSTYTVEDKITDKWATFDVTGFVKEVMDGVRLNNGFLITPVPLSGCIDGVKYASSEYTTIEDRPKLVIELKENTEVAQPPKEKPPVTISQNNNSLTLATPGNEIHSVQLITPQGKTVFKREIGGNDMFSIPTGMLASGFYFLKMNVGNRTVTEQLFIQ